MKYALVTGGSRGIGRACCVKLAEMGYNILINYLGNESAARQTREIVEALGVEAELLRFDVANAGQVVEVLEGWMAKNETKTIEVLVNNAGVRKDNLMFWMSDAEWHSSRELRSAEWRKVRIFISIFSKMITTPNI